MKSVTRDQAVAHRLRVNNLVDRLPPGALAAAAYAGLQDTAPRDALLALHARVAACEPADWEHPSLIQTYSPRAAVYVLPTNDFGVFTLGRLPIDDDAVRRIDVLAERICRALDGEVRRGANLPGLREACASGRIAVRWDTKSLWAREVPRPEIPVSEARVELCRRHLRAFGPTTPKAFSWWSGLSLADAGTVWRKLSDELAEVDFDGVQAWVLQEDLESVLTTEVRITGTRFLVAPDLRLLGRDHGARFVGPGLRTVTDAADSFHPNGVLVDGRIVGAWGRKGGRVSVVLTEKLTRQQYDELAAEVAAMPVPEPQLVVE
ncbi:crosslink repair DNA glycosylase YcaQ family protein [Kribbella sp. NPDC026611]|uniref:DNA glycosylase AlkZ-like family protein n=1 Tax=Kribbella sp. NPDC026611 TaxID=3154911 RepID=UPI0033F4E18A